MRSQNRSTKPSRKVAKQSRKQPKKAPSRKLPQTRKSRKPQIEVVASRTVYTPPKKAIRAKFYEGHERTRKIMLHVEPGINIKSESGLAKLEDRLIDKGVMKIGEYIAKATLIKAD